MYKWQYPIYLNLGSEMLVKTSEGLNLEPFVQSK
jgi:hypothetical protein